jgi:hypothetical protein
MVSSSDDSSTQVWSPLPIGATIRPWYLRVLQHTIVVLM